MSLATINSFYCGLEPFSIVKVPSTPRPGLGSWRGHCNVFMVGATGRNDRSRRWPDDFGDQVAAVKLGSIHAGAGQNSVYSGAAYDRRKGLYPPVESTGANILGMNRDLKLVRTMAILTGPAASGLVARLWAMCPRDIVRMQLQYQVVSVGF